MTLALWREATLSSASSPLIKSHVQGQNNNKVKICVQQQESVD